METLLSNYVVSIRDLNLNENRSWFKHSGNVELLAELVSKQTRLQIISLYLNLFSSNATQTLLTKIADAISSIELTTLNLHLTANFDADKTVEKLAVIFQSAKYLK